MITKMWPVTNGIAVNVCNHRFDATMTFSEQTDSRFESSIYAGELFGFKNNFRMGANISQYGIQYNVGLPEQEATGVIRSDMYYFTDMWKNPTSGNLEVIPDYYATAWTAAGVAAFGTTLGAAKTARTPNHGQNLFDFTTGALGYDLNNSLPGANNLQEFYPVFQSQRDWFILQTGREPSVTSLRNGTQGGAALMYPDSIGNRNSSPGSYVVTNSNTYYGKTLGNKVGVLEEREYFNNFPSSSRAWDNWNTYTATKAQSDAQVTSQITMTLGNHGWYRDFTHWHLARDNGTLTSIDGFLAMNRTTFGSNFVWTCSYGEALEYMFLRNACQRVCAIDKNDQVTLIADVTPQYRTKTVKGIPAPDLFETYNTPVSVKVDLTGTSLAGKTVRSSYGKLRNLGGNVYVAEIPFVKREENMISVTLREGTDGYYNEARPTITTSLVGTTLTVTTDMPTKLVLFSVIAGGNYEDSKPVTRTTDFALQTTFTVEAGKDYRVGAISEFLQCSLKVV